MQQRPDPLGTCAECGATLYPVDILVEYETDDGVQYYAECPECEMVVHPE